MTAYTILSEQAFLHVIFTTQPSNTLGTKNGAFIERIPFFMTFGEACIASCFLIIFDSGRVIAFRLAFWGVSRPLAVSTRLICKQASEAVDCYIAAGMGYGYGREGGKSCILLRGNHEEECSRIEEGERGEILGTQHQ